MGVWGGRHGVVWNFYYSVEDRYIPIELYWPILRKTIYQSPMIFWGEGHRDTYKRNATIWPCRFCILHKLKNDDFCFFFYDLHNSSNLRSWQNLAVMSESGSKNCRFWYRRSPRAPTATPLKLIFKVFYIFSVGPVPQAGFLIGNMSLG